MIGNDVVDLADPAIVDHHRRARFVERVLGDDERAALAASPSPKQLLWSFFAAKEAAYKIVAKRGAPPPFAHRLFFVAPDLRTVRYDAESFSLRVEVQDGAIHAVATSDDDEVVSAVEPVATNAEPGSAARTSLCRSIARHLDCAVDALTVTRPAVPGSWDGFGPPRIERADRPLPIDVSLSHDGRFVAFAWTLPSRVV